MRAAVAAADGERGHFEVAAGRDPLPYLEAMAAMASAGGMLPEQVWDQAPIPSRRLHPGRPTGSAMPLAWAHAEFVKLLISRHLGYPVDRSEAAWRRYQGRRPRSQRTFWWLHAAISDFPAGAILTIATARPASVHWGIDGWQQSADWAMEDTGLGFFAASLPTQLLRAGQRVDFTIRWLDESGWIGRDFQVAVSMVDNVGNERKTEALESAAGATTAQLPTGCVAGGVGQSTQACCERADETTKSSKERLDSDVAAIGER
jgi:glucoamylase